jgi:6-phosphofructokinase 1
MVVEVMGRATGWIAVCSGIASGADLILVPEFPMSLEDICSVLERRRARGRDYAIVVVAEGAKLLADGREIAVRGEEVDAFGHPRLGGIGQVLAREIERRTRHDARVTILGHVQRGGTPTAFDRLLATRMGAFACDLLREGRSGMMAALRGGRIQAVPLAEAAGGIRPVDAALYELARSLFG